jgi:hypothetical protein
MKTYIHLLQYLAEFFVEGEIFGVNLYKNLTFHIR